MALEQDRRLLSSALSHQPALQLSWLVSSVLLEVVCISCILLTARRAPPEVLLGYSPEDRRRH